MELLLSSSRLNFHMDVHECVQQDQHCNYIKMLLTELQIFFLDTNKQILILLDILQRISLLMVIKIDL